MKMCKAEHCVAPTPNNVPYCHGNVCPNARAVKTLTSEEKAQRLADQANHWGLNDTEEN